MQRHVSGMCLLNVKYVEVPTRLNEKECCFCNGSEIRGTCFMSVASINGTFRDACACLVEGLVISSHPSETVLHFLRNLLTKWFAIATNLALRY